MNVQVPDVVLWGAIPLLVGAGYGAVRMITTLYRDLAALRREFDSQVAINDERERFFRQWRHDEFSPVKNLVDRHDENIQRWKKQLNGGSHQ